VLFVILFWGAILVVLMKMLTWIARRHPEARNGAAFVVETLAALAAATAIVMALPRAEQLDEPGTRIGTAVLAAAFAAGAHYFASNTARSPYAVFLPFLLVGLLALRPAVTTRFSTVPAIGVAALGMVLGVLSYWNLRKDRRSEANSEQPQA
jgi:mannose/fructose/N-acetylgalactosamine-specific phosphotransferase system component IIC